MTGGVRSKQSTKEMKINLSSWDPGGSRDHRHVVDHGRWADGSEGDGKACRKPLLSQNTKQLFAERGERELPMMICTSHHDDTYTYLVLLYIQAL